MVTSPPRLATWLPTCLTLLVLPSWVVLTVPMAGCQSEPIMPDFLLELALCSVLVFWALTMLRSRPARRLKSWSAITVLPWISMSWPAWALTVAPLNTLPDWVTVLALLLLWAALFCIPMPLAPMFRPLRWVSSWWLAVLLELALTTFKSRPAVNCRTSLALTSLPATLMSRAAPMATLAPLTLLPMARVLAL